MTERTFERTIDLARNLCEKLYLDAVTADVQFVFEVDTNVHIEIQAHKSILAVNSPVFHAMFYGSMKEGNKIRIVDASALAFIEFLQFFYLNNVRLTSKNIIEVAYLCKKYEVTKGLQVCEKPLQLSVFDNINNICSDYQALLLLQIDSVVSACKNTMIDNAQKVLESPNFLECDCTTFKRIIELLSSKCAASVIIDAGMAWAKAECQRSNMSLTTKNLKAQLMHTIDLMPFDGLTAEQFSEHMRIYNGFFDCGDLQTIVVKALSQQRNDANESSVGALHCDRSATCESITINSRLTAPYTTIFTTNARLLLTEFYIAETTLPMNFTCSAYVLCEKRHLISQRCKLISGKIAHVILSQPILVEPTNKYAICLDSSFKVIGFKRKPFTNLIKINDDIKINFFNDGMVTRLKFQQPIE